MKQEVDRRFLRRALCSLLSATPWEVVVCALKAHPTGVPLRSVGSFSWNCVKIVRVRSRFGSVLIDIAGLIDIRGSDVDLGENPEALFGEGLTDGPPSLC